MDGIDADTSELKLHPDPVPYASTKPSPSGPSLLRHRQQQERRSVAGALSFLDAELHGRRGRFIRERTGMQPASGWVMLDRLPPVGAHV